MKLQEFIRLVCVHRRMNMKVLSDCLNIPYVTFRSNVYQEKLGLINAGRLADFLGCTIEDIPGTKLYNGKSFDEVEFRNSTELSSEARIVDAEDTVIRVKCPCCGEWIVLRVGKD